MKTRLAVLAFLTTLLAACASQPTPLQGAFEPIMPADAVVADRTGTPVRWGGRIVKVEPQPNRTCFEMLSTRLDVYGRPYWASGDVGSRFIACRIGFYDPAFFQVNREVSFTGRIGGYESRRIGQHDYRFARVEADVVYLWPVRERGYPTRPAPWPWWGWW